MAVVSGGTTLIDNGALDAGVSTGSLILLSTQTASASATISFTSGIDSTYDSYVFKFNNIHGETDQTNFQFQVNAVGNTGYSETITSTCFFAQNREDGSSVATPLGYRTGEDQAQGTAFQRLSESQSSDNDQSLSGTLQIFNPSSNTFVKHFLATTNFSHYTDRSYNFYIGGYFNTTTAIDEIQFKMSSGNIDDGIIKMYGVK